MHISELHIYPIKSCGGTALTRAQLTKRGLQADRLLMLVDEEGVFITQREADNLRNVGKNEYIPQIIHYIICGMWV